jgi:hypothetical protein
MNASTSYMALERERDKNELIEKMNDRKYSSWALSPFAILEEDKAFTNGFLLCYLNEFKEYAMSEKATESVVKKALLHKTGKICLRANLWREFIVPFL